MMGALFLPKKPLGSGRSGMLEDGGPVQVPGPLITIIATN